MKMTGADIIVKTLIEQGVTDVFGYPGGQVINIYDALYRERDRINHVLTAHEQGALPRNGQGRRLHRHLRPRCNEFGHGYCHGDAGLDPDGCHYR